MDKKIKVLCYGASVTAQKGSSGYFEKLQNNLQSQEVELTRVSFGASHFDYAGFGYCSMINKLDPDIIVIDWLTPSMKNFSLSKLRIFHEFLHFSNIKVFWFNLPRKDDLENRRACFMQVKNICEEYDFHFVDIVSELPEFKLETERYLRDIVHTTEDGALLYAEVISKKIGMEFKKTRTTSPNVFDLGQLPVIHEFDTFITSAENIQLDVTASRDELEILINCQIGPNVPFLKVSIYQSELIESRVINPADGWCYYNRSMVLPPIRFKIPNGEYRVFIKANRGEPIRDIVLRNPIRKELLTKSKQTLVSNIVTF